MNAVDKVGQEIREGDTVNVDLPVGSMPAQVLQIRMPTAGRAQEPPQIVVQLVLEVGSRQLAPGRYTNAFPKIAVLLRAEAAQSETVPDPVVGAAAKPDNNVVPFEELQRRLRETEAGDAEA